MKCKHLSRPLATATLGLVLLGASPAHAATAPQPRSPGGGVLSNTVTSTSNSNCVTGAEDGCTTTVLETPMISIGPGGPATIATFSAIGLLGFGLLRLRSRRLGRGDVEQLSGTN